MATPAVANDMRVSTPTTTSYFYPDVVVVCEEPRFEDDVFDIRRYMKTLLIMRHAKSSWNYPERSDYERPLNKRGKRDAPRMGEHLHRTGLVPDRILTSSAKRARKTASRVAKSCGYKRKMKKIEALYDTVPGVYFEVLQALPDKYQIVMAIGHNPTMEQLVNLLTGHRERMPTAAIAHIELPIQRWEALDLHTKGTLVNLWTPKTLFSDSSSSD